MGVDVAGRSLLRGITQRLSVGDRLAITGPSGAGKTQLLRVIVGLDNAATGAVFLSGESPSDIGWPTYRRRVSLVPTLHPLLPGTVCENLQAASRYGGRAAPTAEEQRALLEQIGLDVPLDREGSTLSTGEQRRVAIARALWAGPDVLLVDEPTNGLDEASAAVVEARLVRFDGIVVMVSHDMALVERLATDRLDIAKHIVEARTHV